MRRAYRRWKPGDRVGTWTLLSRSGRYTWRARCRCGHESLAVNASWVVWRWGAKSASGCQECGWAKRRKPKLCEACLRGEDRVAFKNTPTLCDPCARKACRDGVRRGTRAWTAWVTERRARLTALGRVTW